MPHPLVIAYHIVWTIYGYWLPNDLRGSTSRSIRKDLLAELGELHHGRKKVQPLRSELLEFFARARPRLAFPVREFVAEELKCVAASFAETIRACRYTCYGCAILRDHVHLLIRKHRDGYEQMVANLQRESHLSLRKAGFFDLEHPIWGGHGWSVFLDEPEDVWRTIRYIGRNQTEGILPPEAYAFVQAYDSWPLHPGHSPNSPYAKRLGRSRGQ